MGPATNAVIVAHGYTLKQLDTFVCIGIHLRRAYARCDRDERYATGWHAAAELLCTSKEPPTRMQLVQAARDAADQETLRTMGARGIGRNRHDGSRSDGKTVRFWAYWQSFHLAESPEADTIEQIALAQIWPRLPKYQQEALQALADHGSYQAAADALGLKYATFWKYLAEARKGFLALWWEGETPRRGWHDRRRVFADNKQSSVSEHIRSRRRAASPA
jgi:hypothetical protein